MFPIHFFLLTAAALFAIGLAIIITKRNAIMVLIGIELLLNATNLNLVAFSQYDPIKLNGTMFALFVILVAAAEAAVALSIILRVYSYHKTTNVDEVSQLKG